MDSLEEKIEDALQYKSVWLEWVEKLYKIIENQSAHIKDMEKSLQALEANISKE